MTKDKILIAEDDPNFGMMLKSYLVVNGYEVELCDDGNKAYSSFGRNDFDLCIFDIMMPFKDGFSLAESIQKGVKRVPFIFLTAKTLKEDQIRGYQLGAADYLVKPFDPEILLLKIKAILRGNKQLSVEPVSTFAIGNFTFDADRRVLKINNKTVKLSPKESALLQLLLIHQDKVLRREEALLKIWKEDSYFTTKSMDVYITKLRKILRQDSDHKIEIENLHGKGFVLSVK